MFGLISVRLAVSSCILSYICTLAYSESPTNSNVFHKIFLSSDGRMSGCSMYKRASFSHHQKEGCSTSGKSVNETLV
ncbi:hypothetical protein HDV63DRAFT_378006 [Trichoderma sp. SZMC 28014]